MAVQPHLRKCFEGINKLEFDPQSDGGIITGMISPEGETVKLKNLSTRGNVEEWLSTVEEGMIHSLKQYLRLAVHNFESNSNMKRTEWVLENYAQIVMTGDSIIWTRIT